MRVPMTRRIALMLTVALAACDTRATSTGVAGGNSATVRVVNASGATLDVVSAGTVATGNGSLAFGTSSSCTATDAAAPDLTVRTTGTSTTVSGFPPALATGGKYVVIAYDANGITQFITIPTSTFSPGGGKSGLDVVDVAAGPGNFDVYVSAPGAALGAAAATNLSVGGSTNFLSVDAGTEQVRLTNAGTQTIAFIAASQTLTAGRNYVLVIGVPATGTTEFRSFLVTSC